MRPLHIFPCCTFLTCLLFLAAFEEVSQGQEGKAAAGDDTATLLEQARSCWKEKRYEQAADAYRRLRDGFPKHEAVRSGEAQFWLWCSLGNAGKTEEQVKEIEAFLKDYPTHRSCAYALYFLGAAYAKLGEEAKAKRAWSQLLEKYPEDKMAGLARDALRKGQASRSRSANARQTAGRLASSRTLGTDFIDGAVEACRWLKSIAVREGAGLAWPIYEGEKARNLGFYKGSAGVCLFFLNMYRITGKEEYADLAKKTAQSLIGKAIKSEGGLCWKEEDGEEGGSPPSRSAPGLYTGAAGIGYVFLCLHRQFGDPVYLDYSRGAADWIVATAQKQGGLRHWGDETDIISGAAGIGLFLLEMHKATGDRRYAECAFGAADWLISQGEKVDGSLKWKSRSSLDRFYTGFSHGTAGVAYFLAKAYESSKEPRYLEHAKAGAAWLMKNAVHERQGVKWFHYEPGHEREFMTGWCHGPAGTCRLFLELHNLTGDAQYLETAKKGAAWLMATLDPASRNAPYHGLSMCCGAAGVGDFFLDLFLATKDEEYLEYAGRVATFLLDRAKSTENGWKWTNYDVPDKTGKIYYGTGHMVGAAGVGSFFLRLHTVLNNMEDRFVSSVDKLPAMPTPERKAKRSYVILTNAPETDAYFEAAKKLSSAHNGSIVRFDPAKMLALRRKLSSLNPRYVAIVLKPQDIDINLQRQMIALSTRMDDDPFCDFAFGFVTGATAKESVSLVERSLRVPREGLPKTIVTASVTSGRKSSVLSGAGMVLAKQLGYEGKAIYWSCVESDPQVLGFVRSHIKEVQKNGVVIFTGNGDPEGIWLFSDRRNLDASRHWPFDPTKVGYDPRGEMPRITAEYFRGVDLGGAVVWSGTCHSGVLHRAFVENDIVSTFGKVDRVTEYTIPPGRSLGLAILSDGPSAYLAPIGPNHGYACSVELHRALSAGLSLGDVMRSRYNEIILGGGGNLDISLYEPDGPMLSENPMRGGGANRTLYGDPLLSPFPNSGKDYLRRRLASLPNGSLRVTCEVVDETAPMFWDMFGNDPQNPERIYTVVELPKGFDHVGTVSASAKAVTGKEISLSPCKWGIEKIDGKTLVHLQVNGLRGALSRQGTTVEFTLLPAKRN